MTLIRKKDRRYVEGT